MHIKFPLVRFSTKIFFLDDQFFFSISEYLIQASLCCPSIYQPSLEQELLLSPRKRRRSGGYHSLNYMHVSVNFVQWLANTAVHKRAQRRINKHQCERVERQNLGKLLIPAVATRITFNSFSVLCSEGGALLIVREYDQVT